MSAATGTKRQTPANTKIGVRPETKRKVGRIRKARRWSWVETMDAIADDYIARHGHDLESTSK